MFLVLICMFGEFVLGLAVVHNVSVNDVSVSTEIIKGEINLTIVDENYEARITSNDNDEIILAEFLELNGVDFDCSTHGCFKDYGIGEDIAGKNFSVPASGKKTIGFVLYGNNVELTGLSFNIESDFDESYRVPLKIEFFEKKLWEFKEFSDTFLPKDWGCYDKVEREEGPQIGDNLYCESISISDSGELRVGADVIISNGETSDLTMSVFSEGGFGIPKTCTFSPGLEEKYCEIEGPFYADTYDVCVNSDETTDYHIYQEDDGENCGFVRSSSTGSIKDYAIFVQSQRYANSDELNPIEFNSDDINDDLLVIGDNLIGGDRYSRDCSGGCILPLSFSGVSQNISISNLKLEHEEGLEIVPDEDNIHDLTIGAVMVNFSGVLDLGLLGFSASKSMEYIVSLGSQELFNKTTEILMVPEIFSVMPLNPPAGVPIRFYARVNFSGNNSLSYKWDFGDGDVVITSEPNVLHSYADLDNYTLNLEVGAGLGLVSARNFSIEAISPRTAVDVNLVSKRSTLDGIMESFDGFTFWYKDALSNIANTSFFSDELDKLEVLRDNASDDQDFVDIAEHLYALNVPAMINIRDAHSPHLITQVEDIDVEVAVLAGGEEGELNNAYYMQPILAWQNKNIDASFSRSENLISLWNGDNNGALNVYSFNVSSDSTEESYFIINMPLSELSFREDVGAKESGESTVIVLNGKEDISFEFYYENDDAILFFVSPKLTSIILEDVIDTSCNYNLVCEKEYGENSINCRSDCKPKLEGIIYVLLGLMVMLIIYTILQVWYKHKYERYLFKDDRQMYNLLMYVTNARAQEMKDSRIAAVLRERGWASERVSYIVKKSRGKRTGLIEIIPIEKVAAFFRNRKARNVQAAKVVAKGPLPVGANIATGNRQQTRRNINKSRPQRKV